MARWGCRGCRAQFGAWLSRCPRCGLKEELVVALNACAECTAKFAVGLPKCPHCGSEDFTEDGNPMAKISRHGGASDKTLPVAEPETAGAAEPPTDAAPAPEPRAEQAAAVEPELEQEGGEGSSPGSSSSVSTDPQPTSSEPSSKSRRRPARRTASRSEPDLTESSSAPLTGGEKTEATSATDTGE